MKIGRGQKAIWKIRINQLPKVVCIIEALDRMFHLDKHMLKHLLNPIVFLALVCHRNNLHARYVDFLSPYFLYPTDSYVWDKKERPFCESHRALWPAASWFMPALQRLTCGPEHQTWRNSRPWFARSISSWNSSCLKSSIGKMKSPN